MRVRKRRSAPSATAAAAHQTNALEGLAAVSHELAQLADRLRHSVSSSAVAGHTGASTSVSRAGAPVAAPARTLAMTPVGVTPVRAVGR